ncbi:hypothetical protein Tco_1579696 [Tanacetum coccineum]
MLGSFLGLYILNGVERKSLDLKPKKESSDEECLTSGSENEEYAMASDSGEEDDEKVKNKTCLVAQASSEIYALESTWNPMSG